MAYLQIEKPLPKDIGSWPFHTVLTSSIKFLASSIVTFRREQDVLRETFIKHSGQPLLLQDSIASLFETQNRRFETAWSSYYIGLFAHLKKFEDEDNALDLISGAMQPLTDYLNKRQAKMRPSLVQHKQKEKQPESAATSGKTVDIVGLVDKSEQNTLQLPVNMTANHEHQKNQMQTMPTSGEQTKAT